MNDAQYTALMAEIIRGNNLLTRIADAMERQDAVMGAVLAVAEWDGVGLAETLPHGVGDTIVIVEGESDFFRAGAKGTIIEDCGDIWYVDFRYNDNGVQDYKDTGGAYAGRWYVNKERCKLLKRGTM